MQDMLKPNIENISAIIDKLDKLKDQKEKLKGTKFLTPVQQKILDARTDIKWYIWGLSEEERQEHFYNQGIPIQYVRARDGRFVVTDKEVLELYGEDESGVPVHRGTRMDLDEGLLVSVLRTIREEARLEYWQKNLQPLIKELDKLLFPYWDYLAMAGSWGAGEKGHIEAAIQSKNPVDLDEALCELDKIKYKITIELQNDGKGRTVPDPTVEEISEIIRNAEELRKLKESYQPKCRTPGSDSYFYPTPGGFGLGDGAEEIMKMFGSLENPEGRRCWPDEVQPLIDKLLQGLAPCRAFILEHGPERLQNWKKVEGWIWTANPDDMRLLIRELSGLKAIVAKITQQVQSSGEGLKEQSSKKAGGKPAKTEQAAKTQRWQEVSLDVIDDDTIRYKVCRDNWQRANYAELGFKDRRKGLPNKLWQVFRMLAETCKNQIIECRTPNKNISKDIDRICGILRAFFGPQDRPICYNKKNKIWKVAFTLTYKSQDSKDS
jgi:hypothetical protein